MKFSNSKIFVCGVMAVIDLAVASPVLAKDGVSFGEDGLSATAGPFDLTLGGRMHLDAATYNDGIAKDRIADVRRARLELSLSVADMVNFRVDRELAGPDGWRNLWASVRPAKGIEIKGGNFTVPFSLEDAQSSNSMTFVERSPVSALTPGFGFGVAAKVARNNWTLSGGYFDDALDEADGRSKERGRGFSGRATWSPRQSRSEFLHLGLAYEHRTFRPTELVRFSYGMGSNLAPTLISTNGLASPTSLDGFGAELSYARKSLQFQGQYAATRLARALAPRLDYAAWYGQVSWMATGENYGYSSGSGVPTGPKIGKRGGGIELAARYGELDLDDVSLDRGKTSSLTVGVSWYVIRNVRVMANYVHSSFSDSLIVDGRNANLGAIRFQLAF